MTARWRWIRWVAVPNSLEGLSTPLVAQCQIGERKPTIHLCVIRVCVSVAVHLNHSVNNFFHFTPFYSHNLDLSFSSNVNGPPTILCFVCCVLKPDTQVRRPTFSLA